MARFEQWIQPGKRRHARIYGTKTFPYTYQDRVEDPGNYSGGKVGVGELIGTNRSIAAPTLADWRGRPITREEMKALTAEEAIKIYKNKYWDGIRADEIRSQIMAEFIADMKSSAGGNAIINLQKALNRLGENVAVDGGFGTQTLEALNRQTRRNEAKVYNTFREEMVAFYRKLKSKQPFKHEESMNEDYPPMADNSAKRWWLWALLITLLLAAIWWAWNNKLFKINW